MSAVYHVNDVAIEPVVAFGQTWLREREVQEALGFPVTSHFRRVTREAELYRDSVRTLDAEGSLSEAERGFSIHGAMQLALYVCRIRKGDSLARAQAFLDALASIRNPQFIRSAA